MTTEKSTVMMTGAKAIVECMKLEGINTVFCVPGESYLPLLDSLYDELQIRLISARHEGGAAFMAEGYAKATGKPGVVLATRGVGAANASIGIHTAYQDSTPMVVFLGQVSRHFRGREGFQEIDLEKYFSPITKWAVEISEVERIPELVQRAFRIAQTGRPGPVVVSLPEDVLPKDGILTFGPSTKRPKPRPSKTELDAIEKYLESAKKPIIIAGGGVKSADAEEALVQFASTYSIPVVTAFRRHDVFPNHHPLYVGHLGLGTSSQVLENVKQADVIFAYGTRLSEVTTQDYSLFKKEQVLVHMDIDFEVIGKVYPPDVGIIADIYEGLEAFKEMNVNANFGEWAQECRLRYENVKYINNDTIKNEPLNKQIISILQKELPSNAIITNDAGNFAGWLHAFYSFREKNTYLGPTSGAMGYGMPAALGAKLANPDRTVVSLSGDGGFMMTMAELETAVRYNIPIISLVFNNRMYGTIRMHQEIHYPRKVIGTILGDLKFSRVAEELGAIGFYVKEIADFKSALQEGLKSQKPVVIEIESDPNEISVSATIEDIRSKAIEKDDIKKIYKKGGFEKWKKQ